MKNEIPPEPKKDIQENAEKIYNKKGKISTRYYEKELAKLQVELVKFQE